MEFSSCSHPRYSNSQFD